MLVSRKYKTHNNNNNNRGKFHSVTCHEGAGEEVEVIG
jgi:hypothetical protein